MALQLIDRRYQQLLKDLGLYTGQIDGLMGPLTRSAIRQFRALNGLPAGETLTQAVIDAFEANLNPALARPENQVARPNQPVINRWPKETPESELIKFFGPVGQNQVMLQTPFPLKLAWDKSTVIRRFSCHQKVHDSLLRILNRVAADYTPSEIERHGFNLFGGCLNVRKIRGGNRWSTHAWGIAVDIDPARNQLNQTWAQAYLSKPECRKFVQAFVDEQWYSLGLYNNFDAMHWQCAVR